MAQTKTALILGATGNIGSEVAQRLLARGWQVRALHRQPDSLTQRDGRIEWRQGDAMQRDDVVRAAQGVSIILHGVNPPGYHNWAGLVLPMIDNTIAAARESGARIVLPGTVYNYGPSAGLTLREDSPQQPKTRKGAIRVELERRLQAAATHGVRTLIVRAGDFFGPGSGNNWLSGGLITPGQTIGAVRYPGQAGVGHQWAYVPDVAETMVRFIERSDELAPFATYHMEGHWDADGRQMIDAIRRTTGNTRLAVRRFPWWLLPLISPFIEVMRELREMRYLWQQPIRLDNSKLRATLGAEPHTAWDDAMRRTLTAIACL